MVAEPDGSRKRVAGKVTETIDLSISDDDNNRTPKNVRDPAASTKRKYHSTDHGPRIVAHSQKKNRQIATNSDHVLPVGLASTHSGSRSRRSRSDRHGQQARPSTQNSALAQRAAIHASMSREVSSRRQRPRDPSSSNGRESSPPSSQVQISRGSASGAMRPVIQSANGSQKSSAKTLHRKRSREHDVEAVQQPAAKKIKYSKGRDRVQDVLPAARTSLERDNSLGAGKDGNPIVISDSPPPETSPMRNANHSRLGRRRYSKPSMAPVSSGVGNPASPPNLKSTSILRRTENRSEVAGYDSITGDKSPTIPESLPGSPEVDRGTTVEKPQNTSLQLFIHPSDRDNADAMGENLETITNLAEQAEELLASQPDDTSVFAAITQVSTTSDAGRAQPPAFNNQKVKHRAMPLTSPTQVSVAQERRTKAVAAPSGRNAAVTTQIAQPAAAKLPPSNMVPNHTTTAIHIEQVIQKYVQELRSDNEYWTRTWLKRARLMSVDSQHDRHGPTSVFRDMKPIEPVNMSEDKRVSDLSARFTTETFHGGSKSVKRSLSIPCTMYHTRTDADVPNYSHFVNIKHSFLARNVTVLQHWPYFGDDFVIEEAPELEEHYFMDVVERERKIKRLAQGENYAQYVEDMMNDIGCAWSDVLRFFLHPEPNVGNDPQALAALRLRDKFCDEDFVRVGQRWTTVLSKLPMEPNPDNVGKAALLCEYFQKITRFPLWHVARRSDYTAELLHEQDPKLGPNEMTCRICMRFDCPYHGQMHENRYGNSSESEQNGSAEQDIVETDIIHPHRVNYRSRVAFPPSVEKDETNAEIDLRSKKVEYWHKRNLNHYPDDRRGPFYPCYHPGTTCEKAQCSCFVDRIPCEKSCACSLTCKRKWQGCDCRKKGGSGMICFEDQRCACFQYGRECDADLCGDCGVMDVLDPVHRHDDEILRGRCHNASIQRGVSRHTILGDSGIHGLGLYACEDIQPHDFVGEYKGEVITKDEAERRGAVYEHQKLSYLFTLNKKQEVDGTLFGNKVRFINHAADKQANIYPRIIMVNTVFRIALYGKRKIKAGQELLFDYGDQFPQDQLGGKANQERKAAPHLRNKNLVKEFDEVVETTDKFGNRRARKAAAGSKRSKLPYGGRSVAESWADAAESSLVARKSTGVPAGRGESRPGAVHSRRGTPADRHAVNAALRQDLHHDMDTDAGRRLENFYVADDGDEGFFQRDEDDDDDSFAPHSEHSHHDQGFDESSPGGGVSEDDDNETDRAIQNRPRSARIRHGDSHRRV